MPDLGPGSALGALLGTGLAFVASAGIGGISTWLWIKRRISHERVEATADASTTQLIETLLAREHTLTGVIQQMMDREVKALSEQIDRVAECARVEADNARLRSILRRVAPMLAEDLRELVMPSDFAGLDDAHR